MKCAQKDCNEKATSYVIWVDGKQVMGCDQHSRSLQKMAAILGSSVAMYAYLERESEPDGPVADSVDGYKVPNEMEEK